MLLVNNTCCQTRLIDRSGINLFLHSKEGNNGEVSNSICESKKMDT